LIENTPFLSFDSKVRFALTFQSFSELLTIGISYVTDPLAGTTNSS